jgi:hypothetical protein
VSILHSTRTWCVLGVASVVFVAAGPTGARGDSPTTLGVPVPSNILQVRSSPNPGVYGNILWAMSAKNMGDVWAVGVQATASSNDTLAIHWNGAAWSATPTPNPVPNCEDGNIQWGGNSLNGVAAVSANDVWAVGSDCYSMNTLLEHWNGTSWSMVAGPRLSPAGGDEFASLYGVAGISRTNVWAVGYRSSSGIQELIEHYDGNRWSVVPGAAPATANSYLVAAAATGPNDVWAVGVHGTSSNLIEHWNGSGWTVVPSPQPAGGSYLDAVTAISPTDAWAVGSQTVAGADVTFTLHWDGVAWSVVPSPNPEASPAGTNDLRSVAAVTANDVWAFGMYQNEHTNFHQHRTLALHWNGVQWRLVGSPSPGRSAELNAATAVPGRGVFGGGLFSNYDINIYDQHYTQPQTLVVHG